jgi:hypothetical protein
MCIGAYEPLQHFPATAAEVGTYDDIKSVKHIFGSVHIIVYKHGIVQRILSVRVFICCENQILHSQTIYRITEKVMPF